MAVHEDDPEPYAIFLGIFLIFLLAEGLLDFVLKIDFRGNWKWLVPYLCLYYAVNYGFVVLPWKDRLAWGLVMIFLFAIQIAANIGSHPKSPK